MIEKIRVASLANDMGIGGTARQIITIDKYLNKEFFEHFIISLGPRNDVRLKFVGDSKIFFVSDPKETARILKENSINILYAHRHGRNEAAHDEMIKDIGKDVAILELNIFSVKDNGDFGQRCDKHVFVSRTNVLKYCTQNDVDFDFKKYKVVYGLVDAANFISKLPTDLEIAEYKNKLGISGCPTIGRISRPVMEKWDDEMLVMWKKLSKINPKIKFLAYGTPKTRKKLLESAGKKENLIMFEPTDSDKKLGLFYSVIDMLVHDSQVGECSCGIIAEAMLFKKPVVVNSTPFPRRVSANSHTRDNGQIEQIKNGENGYVVTNGTAMAYAVNDLFKKPELIKQMGQSNLKEVYAKYEVSVGIRTLEKIFIEAVVEKNIAVSNNLLKYYDRLKFFPDENDVRNWLKEYYFRLKNIYGREYSNSALEKIMLFYLKYSKKIKTLLFE